METQLKINYMTKSNIRSSNIIRRNIIMQQNKRKQNKNEARKVMDSNKQRTPNNKNNNENKL